MQPPSRVRGLRRLEKRRRQRLHGFPGEHADITVQIAFRPSPDPGESRRGPARIVDDPGVPPQIEAGRRPLVAEVLDVGVGLAEDGDVARAQERHDRFRVLLAGRPHPVARRQLSGR